MKRCVLCLSHDDVMNVLSLTFWSNQQPEVVKNIFLFDHMVKIKALSVS